jgi:hypothetical protein
MLKKLLARSIISRPKILFYEDPTETWMTKLPRNNRFYYRKRTPMDHYCIIKKISTGASVTEILLEKRTNYLRFKKITRC